MKDESEQSNPSTGSVGEPMAFAVVQPDSYVVVHTRHAAVVMRETCGGGEIVPLYRKPQPPLTEAEIEAVEQAIDAANGMGQAEPWTMRALRGLLERMK